MRRSVGAARRGCQWRWSGLHTPFMRIEGEALVRLLHDLDDPQNIEYPADFDSAQATADLRSLVTLLERSFPGAVSADTSWEDSVTFARVTLDGAKTRTTEDLVILISSHGRLTFVSLENPGVYLQDEFDVLVDPTDLSRVEEALDAVGYLVATEDSLSSRYDGRTLSTRFPTWEERYFGYP